MNSLALMALALAAESLIGYPPLLQSTLRHPVQWMGDLISFLDGGLNDDQASAMAQKLSGIAALIILMACCGLPALALSWFLAKLPLGWLINVTLATTLLAQKSLRDHVTEVAEALPRSIVEARACIAKIVGRDPDNLSEGEIAKAALETLAENTADGIVAPAFWYAVAGLPGIVIYKAINTADSMIGHKSERYRNFGWAAARLDDLVNLPASRLTGFLFTATASLTSLVDGKTAWRAMMRDAAKHKSPNAGWPEAAMAGAMGLQFGGPRAYRGETVTLATMGEGRWPDSAADIRRGLQLYERALLLLLAAATVLAMALSAIMAGQTPT